MSDTVSWSIAYNGLEIEREGIDWKGGERVQRSIADLTQRGLSDRREAVLRRGSVSAACNNARDEEFRICRKQI